PGAACRTRGAAHAGEGRRRTAHAARGAADSPGAADGTDPERGTEARSAGASRAGRTPRAAGTAERAARVAAPVRGGTDPLGHSHVGAAAGGECAADAGRRANGAGRRDLGATATRPGLAEGTDRAAHGGGCTDRTPASGGRRRHLGTLDRVLRRAERRGPYRGVRGKLRRGVGTG